MKERILDLFSVIALAAVFVLNILFKNQFDGKIYFSVFGLLFVVIGIIIWLIGKKTLGQYFTTSVHPKGLVTTGVYSKIRHPLYYGGIMMYVGISLFFRSWLGLILAMFVIAPMLLYFANKEEGLLFEKFGEKYLDYKGKTLI